MMLEPLLRMGDTMVSLWTLSLGGLVGGLAAGMFGIGGGVIVNPLLISLGIPPRLVAASMSVATLSNAGGALFRDLGRYAVHIRLGLWMGLAAVVGGQAGTWLLGQVERPELVDHIIRVSFMVLLVWLALRLFRKRRPPGTWARTWLSLPFLRLSGPWGDSPASAAGPLLAALLGGGLAALLGVGGGILYVPVLLALYHRPIQDLVPVSQIAVALGSLSVASGHAWHTGNLDARLVLVLVLTGSLGTAVGTRLKAQLDSHVLEKLLAGVLVLAALRLGLQSLGVWNGAPALAAGQGGQDWLPGFRAWCEASRLQLWLGTVGLAIGLTPALAWLQHKVLDRLGR